MEFLMEMQAVEGASSRPLYARTRNNQMNWRDGHRSRTVVPPCGRVIRAPGQRAPSPSSLWRECSTSELIEELMTWPLPPERSPPSRLSPHAEAFTPGARPAPRRLSPQAEVFVPRPRHIANTSPYSYHAPLISEFYSPVYYMKMRKVKLPYIIPAPHFISPLNVRRVSRL